MLYKCLLGRKQVWSTDQSITISQMLEVLSLILREFPYLLEHDQSTWSVKLEEW